MSSKKDNKQATVSRGTRLPARGKGAKVAVLDQTLWKQIGDAATPEELAPAWLPLLCKAIPDITHAVIVTGKPDDGPFSAAAYWPDDSQGTPGLVAVAEKAMTQRTGVVQGGNQEGQRSQKNCDFAYPIIVDEQLYGVTAIETGQQPKDGIRSVMRQLQWGSAWIENVIRRRQSVVDNDIRLRTTIALDLIAALQEEEKFRPACTMAVTELATRLACERVSVGFQEHGHMSVVSVSHSAQIAKRIKLIRGIGAAMDEAMDQKATVLYPFEQEAEFKISHAHAMLAKETKAGAILTIPFAVMGELVGAFTFERPSGRAFSQSDIDLCDCVVSAIGPILNDRRLKERPIHIKARDAMHLQATRLLGPDYFRRKAVVSLALLAIVFFTFATTEYRVTAPARLEGLVQRSIVAPFNGYVLTENARAGDTVRAGDVLATMDDKDLTLERLGWMATRHQYLAELNRALAEHNRAETNIIKAQMDQATAQISLLDEQIKRAELRAPFGGLLVSGDLSQSIGSSVQRGELLFEIAPLNSYRVILEVDESDISEIKVGQQGMLVVSSIPDEPQLLSIDKITPITDAREGRNFFQVHARLLETTSRLRPGMEGVGKVNIESRRLIWIWTHKITDWLRLQLWELLP